MAIRNILQDEDPILRKHSRPVERFDARLHTLLDDMKETLQQANGAGLAAPQVGVLRRVVLVDTGEEAGPVELINPEIVATSGEQHEVEGCLSVPGVWGRVRRPYAVTVRAQDRNGGWFTLDAEGIAAVCCCHETDHLDGVLFVDKVDEFLDPEELDDMDE